jgi:hypothetical protein
VVDDAPVSHRCSNTREHDAVIAIADKRLNKAGIAAVFRSQLSS